MDISQFVTKWRASTLKESAADRSHFEDLCRLVGHETPTDADSSGTDFAYQKAVAKENGKAGFADVFLRYKFGFEYKSKGEDLEKAYQQLLLYRDNLANPPLLITCDFNRIEIHTNFNGTVSATYVITLDDLEAGKPLANSPFTPLEILRKCFYAPEDLRPDLTPEALTTEAANIFGKVAESLRKQWQKPDDAVAKYLTRVLFCMFASDVGLLPKGIISDIIDANLTTSKAFANDLSELFTKMSTGGRFWGKDIPYFDGGLFSDGEALEIDGGNLYELRKADQANWSGIEPSIFGTLFERILNPAKRSQLGAHYTSRTDIDVLVEPVLMWPLQRQWAALQSELKPLEDWQYKANQVKGAMRDKLTGKLQAFLDDLAAVTVLDPACGSGNFLYVALAWLKDLEKKVIAFGAAAGITSLTPKVHPRQLFGIEIDPYAHELASIVVWIGYLQWKYANGIPLTTEIPVLEPLTNIHHMNAIVDMSDPTHPREPEWPEATVIVGNPPFLGGKKLRGSAAKEDGLGDDAVEALFAVWDGRVRRESDLCCYWFEKARAMIAAGKVKRAGLLATQGIRGGANRDVLKRIKASGDIFFAESDREWTLDGAAVRVSMVGFDDGSERVHQHDGATVAAINADLTSATDLTKAVRLPENAGISFMGDTKVGPFEISAQRAKELLVAPNPHGKPNSDVVRPWVNGSDITGRTRGLWIIDFAPGMGEADAALYEHPFEYVKRLVFPARAQNARAVYAKNWWIHGEPRPAMRAALDSRPRYLVTPSVAKYRVFRWVWPDVLADHKLFVFARSDDYFFGVLHSRLHEVWSLATSSRHGVGNDPVYNNTTCFETFPLPWPPGQEPADSPLVHAIAEAARTLNEHRENWLNPTPPLDDAALKKRTLTNLYNQRQAGEATWLDIDHRKLDEAVFAAYGWPPTLTDDEVLAKLLELNLQRATP